jgi:hypothetical protein
MITNIDYFSFVKRYLDGQITGLYFIHLADGCRSSLAKLSFIEKRDINWYMVSVNPEIDGHSPGFIMDHFIDLPSMHILENSKLIKSLDSFVWPYEIEELEEYAVEKNFI